MESLPTRAIVQMGGQKAAKTPSDNLLQSLRRAIAAKSRTKPFSLTRVNGKPMLFERRPSLWDEQKYLDFAMTEADRNFWFNLVIGCSGPNSASPGIKSTRGFRSRDTAKLEYALSDVSRLHDFTNGSPVLFAEMRFPPGGRPVAGTFAETVYLREPSTVEFFDAFDSMSSFFERNQDDPEFFGGQVNLFFSGHGVNTPAEGYLNRGGLFLHDGVITPAALQQKLIEALPAGLLEGWPGPGKFGSCRVDMYLDCCYSGQLAAALAGRLLSDRKGLVPGRFWCSSMPFQQAFESDSLKHGVFTAYFLNDFSARKHYDWLPASLQPQQPSLRAGDVGKDTRGKDTRVQETPWLLAFTEDGGLSITIPGAVGTNAIARDEVPISQEIVDDGQSFAEWLTKYLQAVYDKNWAS